MKNWGASEFNLGDLEKTVSFIHLCAYQNEENKGDEDDRPPTNHWAAFLQANGRGSARLDMISGDGADGLTGMLVIESKTYEFTHNATQRVSFATLGQPTVQTITDLVSRLDRDKYRFTENEEGCRYWIYTFISDLECAGIVAADRKGEA